MPRGPMPPVAKAFEMISTAQVAKSAFEAKEMLLLRPGDGITMNRDRLLAEAKARALSMVEGYAPPEAKPIRLPGPSGKAALAMAVQQQVPCRILSFDAPLDVLRERVERRLRKGGNASEATLVVLEAQLKCREPLDAGEQELAIRVDTSHPVDWVALLPAMD